jgi:uncharacterized membrane protein (UPF0127 family)
MAWLWTVACAQDLSIQLDGHALSVEVADDEAERAQGLMHRNELADGRGMLFVYPDSAVRGFWMKNTHIPLSIAFVAADGTIVRIADMTPLSLERVSSVHPARYAVEVPRGWFAAKGIEKGDKVTGLPP